MMVSHITREEDRNACALQELLLQAQQRLGLNINEIMSSMLDTMYMGGIGTPATLKFAILVRLAAFGLQRFGEIDRDQKAFDIGDIPFPEGDIDGTTAESPV